MKNKKIVIALICSLCVFTSCNSKEKTKDKDSDRSDKNKISVEYEEDETKGNETVAEQSVAEETITVETTAEVVNRVCNGQAISFEVPEDSWYEDYAEYNIRECYRVYMYPDADYQKLIAEGNAWNDNMSGLTTREEQEALIQEMMTSPQNYLAIDCDARESLEWFYDEDIPNALTASDYCYQDYIDTGYASASSPTKNATGKYTIDIDGHTAYVVWHSGSSDNPILNAITYECYVDLPSGNIMSITYCDYSSTIMSNVQFVLESIKFN